MYDIRTINLKETCDALNLVDAELPKEIRAEIRRMAKPTLSKAKGYASGVGSRPTGQYAGSLKIKSRASGVAFVSTDPGGGVIEFANIGAVILHGPRKGERCPVPHGSAPPRALMKAFLEDEDDMTVQLNRMLDEYLETEIG